jgi:hypothetical protein
MLVSHCAGQLAEETVHRGHACIPSEYSLRSVDQKDAIILKVLYLVDQSDYVREVYHFAFLCGAAFPPCQFSKPIFQNENNRIVMFN